jgi:transcriptional regulator with XRE-family HTH domain
MRTFKTWGAWIKAVRNALGLSQDAVAFRSGVSVGALRNYEAKRGKRPDEDKRDRIEAFLSNEAKRTETEISQPPAR